MNPLREKSTSKSRTDMNIEFMPIKGEIDVFKDNIKKVLSIGVIETFGSIEGYPNDENIISDTDIEAVLKQSMEEVYFIEIENVRIGAVALNVNIKNKNNNDDETPNPLRGVLDFLIIYPEHHGKGYGTKIIEAIEQKYPHIRVWELITPYFEKRNIHFYINKCGYKIVEFFNEHHKDKTYRDKKENIRPFEREYFRFEKTV